MNILIKISELMTSNNNSIILEHKLIRISKKLREQLDFKIGDILPLTCKDGTTLELKVANVNLYDLQNLGDTCYVTEKIFSKLKLSKFEKIESKISLGADPELFVLNTHRNIVSSKRFFTKEGKIGYDGLALELRPDYTLSPLDLTNNLKELLQKANTIVKNQECNLSLFGTSCYYGIPTGFHIHFGIPKILLNNTKYKFILDYITYILDYFLAIPSILPEGVLESDRRSTPFLNYGKIGDYRVNNTTYEYRVLGGALLKSKILTTGAFSVGVVIVEDIIEKINIFTNNFKDLSNLDKQIIKKWYNIDLTEQAIRSIVSSRTIEGALIEIPKILNNLKNINSFNKYSKDIYNFFNNLTTSFNSLEQEWDLH